MKAPFPWFGGKSKVAHLVWERFGDVPNYVEPFFGSGAVLLGRPFPPGEETINDLDCYVANFWRAIQLNAYEVAMWAEWPVNEVDLHARHAWLVSLQEFRERMMSDPNFFDPKVAGWWVWGICQWIGGAWCAEREDRPPRRMPRPFTPWVWLHGHSDVYSCFADLAGRLRKVKVYAGDWSRVLGPSVTTSLGLTGVFLDPPFGIRRGDDAVYAHDDRNVAPQVREWALDNAHNSKLRIALCGYEDEHEMPDDWTRVIWKHGMGYSERSAEGDSRPEVIWFSPHCLPAVQQKLAF